MSKKPTDETPAARVAVPAVLLAIAAIQAEFANREPFTSAGALKNTLADLLTEKSLLITPRMISRETLVRTIPRAMDPRTQCVVVEVEFDLVSVVDGSKHLVRMFGEASDAGDQATSGAMAAAYLCAMSLTFNVRSATAKAAPAVAEAAAASPEQPEESATGPGKPDPDTVPQETGRRAPKPNKAHSGRISSDALSKLALRTAALMRGSADLAQMEIDHAAWVTAIEAEWDKMEGHDQRAVKKAWGDLDTAIARAKEGAARAEARRTAARDLDDKRAVA